MYIHIIIIFTYIYISYIYIYYIYILYTYILYIYIIYILYNICIYIIFYTYTYINYNNKNNYKRGTQYSRDTDRPPSVRESRQRPCDADTATLSLFCVTIFNGGVGLAVSPWRVPQNYGPGTHCGLWYLEKQKFSRKGLCTSCVLP